MSPSGIEAVGSEMPSSIVIQCPVFQFDNSCLSCAVGGKRVTGLPAMAPIIAVNGIGIMFWGLPGAREK